MGICDMNGVTGYPTLKYYLNGSLNDYNGSREYEELYDFIQDTLLKPCLIYTMNESCNGKQITYIKKWKTIDLDRVKRELKRWIVERVYLLGLLVKDREISNSISNM